MMVYIADGEIFQPTFFAKTDERAVERLEHEKKMLGDRVSKAFPVELYRKIA